MRSKLLLFILFLLVSVVPVRAQTTAFTYQGKLSDGANPASGNYDIQFKLFDTATIGTGAQQGPTVTNPSVTATAGIFTVQLDFGAGAFSGPPRFLEIGVRPAGSSNPYTVLSPRQPLTSAPYSVRSLNSSVADVLSSACVGCVTSTQVGSVSGSVVTGLIPVASVPPGSGSYVQNTTSQQGSSNFNISGDGTAGGTLTGNIVKATTQFNIGINHALSLATTTGVFAGRLAGVSNTTGSGNAFFGDSAGRFNTTSSNNSFFGSQAGTLNTASDNSFFGAFAGDSNTTGTRNSFFGRTAGDANVSGADNSFFGYTAGRVNTASFNSFFGSNAGNSTTTGANNSFFGYNAGQSNVTGEGNTFFGYSSGGQTTVNGNSFFGRSAGASNQTGVGNAFFGYEAGLVNSTGTTNSFFGYLAGQKNTISDNNAFFGSAAGFNSIGARNSFFGSSAGSDNVQGNDNTSIGANTSVGNLLNFATVIGAGATATTSNSVTLGRTADTVKIPGALRVTGVVNATGAMNVTGNTFIDGNTRVDGTLFVGNGSGSQFTGLVEIDDLGGGGNTNVCINSFFLLSTCSSSLRYKTSVEPFIGGLDVVLRLRPIMFNWKQGGMRDVGFGAEEVEKVEPLLTTRNSKGEIEGVKYGQITTVLVTAVKEQQAQIADQQHTIEQQQRQLEALTKLVCASNSQAEVCKKSNE